MPARGSSYAHTITITYKVMGLENLNKAQATNTQNLTKNTQAQTANNKALVQNQNATKSVVQNQNQMNNSLKTGGQNLQQFNTKVTDTNKQMTGLAAKFRENKSLVFGGVGLVASMTEGIGMLSMYADSMQRVNDAQAEVTRLEAEGAQGTREYAAATGELTDAQRALRFAQRNTILSLFDMIPFMLLLVNGILKFKGSTDAAGAATGVFSGLLGKLGGVFKTQAAAAVTSSTATIATGAAGNVAAGGFKNLTVSLGTATIAARGMSTAMKGLLIATGVGIPLAIGSFVFDFASAFSGHETQLQKVKRAANDNLTRAEQSFKQYEGGAITSIEKIDKVLETHQKEQEKVTAAILQQHIKEIDSLITKEAGYASAASAAAKANRDKIAQLKMEGVTRVEKELIKGETEAMEDNNEAYTQHSAVLVGLRSKKAALVEMLGLETAETDNVTAAVERSNTSLGLSATLAGQHSDAWNTAFMAMEEFIPLIGTQITNQEQLTQAVEAYFAPLKAQAELTDKTGFATANLSAAEKILTDFLMEKLGLTKEDTKAMSDQAKEADKVAEGIANLEKEFGVTLPRGILTTTESLQDAKKAMDEWIKATDFLDDMSGMRKPLKMEVETDKRVKEFFKDLPKGLQKKIKLQVQLDTNRQEIDELFKTILPAAFKRNEKTFVIEPRFQVNEKQADAFIGEMIDNLKNRFEKKDRPADIQNWIDTLLEIKKAPASWSKLPQLLEDMLVDPNVSPQTKILLEKLFPRPATSDVPSWINDPKANWLNWSAEDFGGGGEDGGITGMFDPIKTSADGAATAVSTMNTNLNAVPDASAKVTPTATAAGTLGTNAGTASTSISTLNTALGGMPDPSKGVANFSSVLNGLGTSALAAWAGMLDLNTQLEGMPDPTKVVNSVAGAIDGLTKSAGSAWATMGDLNDELDSIPDPTKTLKKIAGSLDDLAESAGSAWSALGDVSDMLDELDGKKATATFETVNITRNITQDHQHGGIDIVTSPRTGKGGGWVGEFHKPEAVITVPLSNPYNSADRSISMPNEVVNLSGGKGGSSNQYTRVDLHLEGNEIIRTQNLWGVIGQQTGRNMSMYGV